jgi:aminoglycoside phosphotransferase family enzyme/predicted kinase
MEFNILNMLNPDVYDHPVREIELIETHISWVILTGKFVYKIKKPVNFGFLDFSTLEKRKTFCEQEVDLNRRLAPDIYLGVVSISGTVDKPIVSAKGKVFEYAVKMRQFPQSSQLDNMLSAGDLSVAHIDAIAFMVANFHQSIAVATEHDEYGNNDKIIKPVMENFELISESLKTLTYIQSLDELQQWNRAEFEKQESVFKQRKNDGFVRECHGDMHLRNLVWLDDTPVAFDCIEFNPDLRWIDVISEVAFLVMDLQDQEQDQLANRFLNHYLEITGDYAGLSVLPFYLCYRAMVRAKVDALRIGQMDKNTESRQNELKAFESYLDLANSYTKPPTPALIIMRGLSASGKSTVSQQLLEKLGAIRIRSDIERKRLFGRKLEDKASNDIDKGIYSARASEQTYVKLLYLASEIIIAGFTVIIDAAFLKHQQRKPFQALASRLAVPYTIVEATAPIEVLRKRIIERKNDVSDADLSVLNNQIKHWKPLNEDELGDAVTVDTNKALDIVLLIAAVHTH